MKTTNQLTRFLAMVIFIALFFALAGIGNLFGQELPLKSNYRTFIKNDSISYILCDSIIYDLAKMDSIGIANSWSKKTVTVDSVYTKGVDSLRNHFGSSLINDAIYAVYFFSKDQEVFISLMKDAQRNKEHWPQMDISIYKIYGKKLGNTIYIREELVCTEYLRSGWIGQIIWLFLLGGFFTLWIFCKRKDIKRGYDNDEGTKETMWILLGLSLIAFASARFTDSHGSIGRIIYSFLFFFFIASSITANIVIYVKMRKSNRS